MDTVLTINDSGFHTPGIVEEQSDTEGATAPK
jgi:hypothetical protein